MRRFAAGLAFAAAAAATGCTRMEVTSDPPGAQVVWSPDGMEPFRPWPPRALDSRSGRTVATPYSQWGTYPEPVFVTVEKDGYRRPLPRIVELQPRLNIFRKQRLAFELAELPETTNARMRAEGKVRYRGEWVDPRPLDLIEVDGEVLPRAEHEARVRAAQGLVSYNGEWMTPAQRDGRYRAEQLAAGLVERNGRWMTPEAAQAEALVDERVRAIASGGGWTDLDAPRVLGNAKTPFSQLQLFNNSGVAVEFLLSGPSSVAVPLEPYSGFGVKTEDVFEVLPGEYAIAVVPLAEGAMDTPPTSAASRSSRSGNSPAPTAAYTTMPLADGFKYSFTYVGTSRDGLINPGAYEPPPVVLPFTPTPEELPRTGEVVDRAAEVERIMAADSTTGETLSARDGATTSTIRMPLPQQGRRPGGGGRHGR